MCARMLRQQDAPWPLASLGYTASGAQCSAVQCASPIIVHTDVGDVGHIHMVQPMAARTQHVATLVVLAVRSGQQW